MLLTMPAPAPDNWQGRSARFLPFIAILLAHLGLFYLLQHGLASKAVQPIPLETVIKLMHVAQAPAQPSKPLPQPQKFLSPAPTLTIPAPEIVTSPTNQAAETSISVPSNPPVTSTALESGATLAIPAIPKLVSGVEYLQAPQPDYPPLARRMGQQGKVTLRVLVNENGRAERVEIQQSSGFNRLDEAARLAVLRALFKPYVEDGKALMMLATATINFSLSG